MKHAMEVQQSLVQQMRNTSLRLTELPSAHLESNLSSLPNASLKEDNATGRRKSRRQSLKEKYVVNQTFDNGEDSENEDAFVDIKFEVKFNHHFRYFLYFFPFFPLCIDPIVSFYLAFRWTLLLISWPPKLKRWSRCLLMLISTRLAPYSIPERSKLS